MRRPSSTPRRGPQSAGIEVQTGGQLGQKVSKPATESSELIGILAAMVILTFAFGTVVAMVLPIFNAIVALASTLSIVYILSHAMTVSTVAPTLATMIGLGVGIDYALFIVTRHLRGLREGVDCTSRSPARSRPPAARSPSPAGPSPSPCSPSRSPASRWSPPWADGGDRGGRRPCWRRSRCCRRRWRSRDRTSTRSRPRAPPAARADAGLLARFAHAVAAGRRRRTRRAGDPHPPLDPAPLAQPGPEGRRRPLDATTARQAYDQTRKDFGPGVNGPLIVAVSLGAPATGTDDPA